MYIGALLVRERLLDADKYMTEILSRQRIKLTKGQRTDLEDGILADLKEHPELFQEFFRGDYRSIIRKEVKRYINGIRK